MNLEVNESDWKFLRLFLFGVFQGIEQKGFSKLFLGLQRNFSFLRGEKIGRILYPEETWSSSCESDRNGTVDGWNPANQWRFVVYPTICRVSYIQTVAGFSHQQQRHGNLLFLEFWKLERGPWLFRAYRDEQLPFYVEIIINYYKDPYETTRIRWKVIRFLFRGSCKF